MQEARPVLIVGAGPTGMTAAMELSRLGIPVRIVDKLAEFSNTSRALAVQARTLELFAQRGLAEEILRIGNRGRAATIYGDGKQLGKVDLSLIESRYNFILLIAQSETERILREQLARQGITIERSTELVAISQEDEAEPGDGFVTAILRKSDGSLEEIKAAYLIAAEGAHSLVRHTLHLDFPGKSLPHTYALADLHIDGDLPEDELSIFVSEHGLLACFPMGARRFRLIASEKEGPDTDDPDLGKMQGLYDAGSHIPARLHDLVWSSHFRINSRMLDHLRVGRIFFGGDSAHVHSPAGGQGMNTGIQDMINLSWKLALVYRGTACAELLDTYEEERLPVIDGIVSTTERATDAFTSDKPYAHVLLEHLAPLVLQSQKAQHVGAGILSELEANYRQSPLSGSGSGFGSGGTVRAGDRAPDIKVTAAENGQVPAVIALLALLDPSRFTLLVAGQAQIPPAFHAASEDPGWLVIKHLFAVAEDGSERDSYPEAFGLSEWILVRPDGYIALLGTSADTARIQTWLSRWLPMMQS